MKVLLMLAASFVGSQCVSPANLTQVEWELFKAQYNKSYNTSEEDKYRMNIFFDNTYKIDKHNKLFYEGKFTYKLRMNKHGDLLLQEFIQLLNGLSKTNNNKTIDYIPPAHVKLPVAVDWRSEGAVTVVQDQGDKCRSSWSFSATGSLEGQNFRLTNKLVDLSEQNLIDCSNSNGNNGCEGGNIQNSFDYIKINDGIDTDTSYPYQGKGVDCHYKPENKGAEVRGFVVIPRGNETALKAAVATIGPISATIDASSDEFRFYAEGVYSNPECSSTILDRAVLIVGYGSHRLYGKQEYLLDYWLVKNSLGLDWGDQGYMQLIRNNKNTCGIATEACFPLV